MLLKPSRTADQGPYLAYNYPYLRLFVLKKFLIYKLLPASRRAGLELYKDLLKPDFAVPLVARVFAARKALNQEGAGKARLQNLGGSELGPPTSALVRNRALSGSGVDQLPTPPLTGFLPQRKARHAKLQR